YEPGKFKRHEWQTTIELGSFIILDDDRITVADTWTSTAGPKDLRKSDIFKCDFSNEQLQRLIAGEEQAEEEIVGVIASDKEDVHTALDAIAMDVESDDLLVDATNDAPTVEVEEENVHYAEDVTAMATETDGQAMDAPADAPAVGCPSVCGDDAELPLN
ncbi:hypothetical protein CYMTET_7917, partial [Cymbomonas tetramitiformis]